MLTSRRPFGPIMSGLALALAVSACDSSGPQPAGLEATNSTQISGVVGRAVSQPPSVVVRDAAGRPVANAEVRFTLLAGTGSLAGTHQRTDSQGRATLGEWVLGTTLEENRLTAWVEEVGQILFRAQPVADAASALVVLTQPSETVRSGSPLERQPVVGLLDQYGNRAGKAGWVVTATLARGDGQVANANTAQGMVVNETAITDDAGEARFQRLAVAAPLGDRQLIFASEGLSMASSEAVTLMPGAPAGLSLVRGLPANLVLGTRLSAENAPVVQLRDEWGNDVPEEGWEVFARLASGSGHLENASAFTDPAGQATFEGLIIRGGGTGPRVLSFGGDNVEAIEGPPVTVQGRWQVFLATGGARGAAIPPILVNGQPIQGGVLLDDQTVLDGDAVTVTIPSGPLSNGYSLSHWHWRVFDASNPNFKGLADPNLLEILETEAVTAGGNGVYPSTTITIPGSQINGPLYLNVRFRPPPPASMIVHGGNGQSAQVGVNVAMAPVVRVLNAAGNPVANVPVAFVVTAGGGSVTGATSTSDGSGFARVGSWRMGSSPGQNRLEARVQGVSPAVFTATATETPPSDQGTGGGGSADQSGGGSGGGDLPPPPPPPPPPTGGTQLAVVEQVRGNTLVPWIRINGTVHSLSGRKTSIRVPTGVDLQMHVPIEPQPNVNNHGFGEGHWKVYVYKEDQPSYSGRPDSWDSAHCSWQSLCPISSNLNGPQVQGSLWGGGLWARCTDSTADLLVGRNNPNFRDGRIRSDTSSPAIPAKVNRGPMWILIIDVGAQAEHPLC